MTQDREILIHPIVTEKAVDQQKPISMCFGLILGQPKMTSRMPFIICLELQYYRSTP